MRGTIMMMMMMMMMIIRRKQAGGSRGIFRGVELKVFNWVEQWKSRQE